MAFIFLAKARTPQAADDAISRAFSPRDAIFVSAFYLGMKALGWDEIGSAAVTARAAIRFHVATS